MAIRAVVGRYNVAAAALSPSRRELCWDEVVEYAFLAGFDLLCDAQQDIRSQPWATPAAHQAMDGYFKLLRAEEEIVQLNVEICQFLTFMHDKDAELSSKKMEVGLTDPALAYQIQVQHSHITRFTPHHLKNIHDIGQLLGFSGNLSCGVHLAEPSHPAPVLLSLPLNRSIEVMVEDEQIDVEADLEEEQAGKDEEQAVMSAYYSILEFTCDNRE